jgi:glutamate-1-semialdehyde 2,1-aminomutase
MTTGVSRREDLTARANQVLGGTISNFLLPDDINVIVERAEGPYLYDVEGRRYIDYLLGSGPMLLGHSRPEIVAAIQEQVAKGMSFFVLNEPVICLAEKIVEIVPCAEGVRFCSTGTEATFYALRIARTYTRKPKILKFEGGYHGMHDYALMSAVSQVQTAYPTPIPDSRGIPEEVEGDVIVARWNDVEMTERLVRDHAHELAAVICEPLQRALIPAPGFLKEVRAITERFGVLLIFDEIVTGFRLAYGGAQEKYDVVPDLATFGKALSAGYPMAAVAGRHDILGVTSPARATSGEIARMAGTMSGNPVGSMAALVSLDLLAEDGVYDRLYATADRLKGALRRLAAERGVQVQVLGEGALFQMLFAGEPISDYPGVLKADHAKSRRFGLECIRRGVTTTPGEKFYISTVHSDDDVEETIAVFAQAFDAVLEA